MGYGVTLDDFPYWPVCSRETGRRIPVAWCRLHNWWRRCCCTCWMGPGDCMGSACGATRIRNRAVSGNSASVTTRVSFGSSLVTISSSGKIHIQIPTNLYVNFLLISWTSIASKSLFLPYHLVSAEVLVSHDRSLSSGMRQTSPRCALRQNRGVGNNLCAVELIELLDFLLRRRGSLYICTYLDRLDFPEPDIS